jgi:hypothetical protein
LSAVSALTGPDDRRLNARVVEVNGIGVCLRLQVIDPAQEIIGVGVHTVGRPYLVHVGPAAGDLEVVGGDLEE